MNRMTLLGRVRVAPSLKYTQGGTPVLEVEVADTTRKGETYVTQNFNVKLYGKMAEDFALALKEGSEVWTQGEYERRTWRSRDGIQKTAEELKADYFRICIRPGDGHEPPPDIL